MSPPSYIHPATAREEGGRVHSWGLWRQNQWGKTGVGMQRRRGLDEKPYLETSPQSLAKKAPGEQDTEKKHKEPPASYDKCRRPRAPSPAPCLRSCLRPFSHSSDCYSLTLLMENLMRPSVNGAQIFSLPQVIIKLSNFFPLTCCWFSNYSCSK